MIKSILKLRLKQIFRAVSEIGLFRIIVLFAIVSIIFFALFTELANTKNIYYVSGIYFLLVFFIHIKRQDIHFLKIYFEKYKTIQFFEYLIISLPLIVGLAIYNYLIIPIYLFALLITVHIEINIEKSSRNSKIQRLIPNPSFEWKAGLRKNLLSISALWLIGLTTSFFIGSVPIAILIFAIFQISFFEKGEDLQMLLALEMSSKKFIFEKIKMQILLFSALVVPLILAFLIFHSEMWYIILTEYFLLISLQIFFVILKYAFFKPGEKSAGMQMYSNFGIISIFFFVFLPIVWILTAYFYFKSVKKLNFYLNDYN